MQMQNFLKIVLEDNDTKQLLDMKTNFHLKYKEQDYLVGVLEDTLNFFLFENQPDFDNDDEHLLSIVEDKTLIAELLEHCPERIQLIYKQQEGGSNIVLFPRETL
ncbi:hypothetical protein A9986_14450 [Solibacillus silvestris]|nr:hypothetical protein [Solibacillus silvestris]OBW54817.1 hypothetical protein A9986_14450 [Solibacillus silvestris]